MTHTKHDAKPTLTLLGSSGFIGRAIAHATTALGTHHLRPLHRATSNPSARIDLRERHLTRRQLRDSDVIVHSASYIGDDPQMLHDVNVRGTQNVIDGYKRSRAQRLIYISTAGVYGRGPFEMAKEGELLPRPESPLSASRARAEQLVLDAGGIIIRPHLVLGPGDHWVGPAILRRLTQPNPTIEHQTALQSVIGVEALATAIAELSAAPTVNEHVLHATQAPISIGHLAQMLRPYLRKPEPHTEAFTNNQLGPEKLTHTDHTFSADRLQQHVSIDLGSTYTISATAGAWYHNYPI